MDEISNFDSVYINDYYNAKEPDVKEFALIRARFYVQEKYGVIVEDPIKYLIDKRTGEEDELNLEVKPPAIEDKRIIDFRDFYRFRQF